MAQQSLGLSIFHMFAQISAHHQHLLFVCELAVVDIIFRYNKFWPERERGRERHLFFVLGRKTSSRSWVKSSSAIGHTRVICPCLSCTGGWETIGISSIHIGEDMLFQEGRSSGGVDGRKWLEGSQQIASPRRAEARVITVRILWPGKASE